MDSAVIFDCDGVLLHLEAAEEDVFFASFAPHCDPAVLSRDWNSYGIRNDDDIVDEILRAHKQSPELKAGIKQRYFDMLEHHLKLGGAGATLIDGAAELLSVLGSKHKLGVATANFHEAARLRLSKAGLWSSVAVLSQGADGGGHKREILARLLRHLDLPRHRIVYVGDNCNDVEAGLAAKVHFIGFSQAPERRIELAAHGAHYLSASHPETRSLVEALLCVK